MIFLLKKLPDTELHIRCLEVARAAAETPKEWTAAN